MYTIYSNFTISKLSPLTVLCSIRDVLIPDCISYTSRSVQLAISLSGGTGVVCVRVSGGIEGARHHSASFLNNCFNRTCRFRVKIALRTLDYFKGCH